MTLVSLAIQMLTIQQISSDQQQKLLLFVWYYERGETVSR